VLDLIRQCPEWSDIEAFAVTSPGESSHDGELGGQCLASSSGDTHDDVPDSEESALDCFLLGIPKFKYASSPRVIESATCQ
jgi:hypothetical protein